jgi:hypothetical protein
MDGGLRAPRSWGRHQEEAARALSQLILTGTTDAARAFGRRGRLPGGLVWTPEHVDQLLWCREAILDAAGDQLYQLNGGRPISALVPGTPTATVAHLLWRRPRLDRSEATASPAEMLATPSPNPTVELWRHAAVELTAGAHALAGAELRPWTSSPEAAWWLLGETAMLTESVLVLDAYLQRPGMLGEVDIAQSLTLDTTTTAKSPTRRMRGTALIEEQRIALVTVAAQARLYGTDPAAERATARKGSAFNAPGPSVVSIDTVADVVPAQEQLARLLRGHARRGNAALPAPGAGPAPVSTDRMNLALARVVLRTQLELNERLLSATRRKPEGYRLAQVLEDQVERLTSVAEALEHLQERGRSQAPQGPVTQVRELRAGLDLVGADLNDLDLTQLTAIGEAAQATTRQAARMTRSEFNHTDGTIVLRRPLSAKDQGPRRIRVRAALDAAVRSQWPKEDLIPATTTARAALRDLLRDVRIHDRTPSPFPAARVDAGDSGESPLAEAVRETAPRGRHGDMERLRRGRETLAARRLAAKAKPAPEPESPSPAGHRLEREPNGRASSPSVKPPSQ